MTYRASRGGRADRRRAHKLRVEAARIQDGVRAWLTKHPPRAEMPLEAGVWRRTSAYPGDLYDVEFSATPRPTHPIVYVPAYPSVPRSMLDPRTAVMRPIQMRPIQMGMTVGSTRLRWWNWEPVSGAFGGEQAEADMYANARKIEAFMIRVRPLVERLAQWDQHGFETGVPGDVAMQWWNETIEAFGAWMGRVRMRYVLPGDASHEASEAVAP